AFLLAQLSQSSHHIFRNDEMLKRPARALYRRAWSIGRNCQDRWRAVKLLLPVIELRLEHFSRQPRPLPLRVVGVLNMKIGERRWRANGECAIELGQLIHQYAN